MGKSTKAKLAYYYRNKDICKVRMKNRREKIRLWHLEIKKTLACSKCGENHPSCIQFHHLDPSIKTRDVADMVNWGAKKETILAEMKKCIVLCANCHMKLHWNEKNSMSLV